MNWRFQQTSLTSTCPKWTEATIENIFATHLEDWPALLRSLRIVGENIRQHSGAEQAQLREVKQPVN